MCRCSVYAVTDELLRQEIEAAVRCACEHINKPWIDISIQFYGLPKNADAVGQLSFPAFIATLSAASNQIIDGVFHGCATLLGSLTCTSCNNPDAVLNYADRRGFDRIYTAVGFSERVKQSHQTEIFEFLNTNAATALVFGYRGAENSC